MITIHELKRIAEIQYHHIVKSSIITNFKLRLFLVDESFIDINLSMKDKDKFGFHWETLNPKNEIFRYDNFPDSNCRKFETFPNHFHCGSQENVINSPFPKDILPAFHSFMLFVSEEIKRAELS
jgi:hypothetical protein